MTGRAPVQKWLSNRWTAWAGGALLVLGLSQAALQLYVTNVLRGNCVTGGHVNGQFTSPPQDETVTGSVSLFPLGHSCLWSTPAGGSRVELDAHWPASIQAYGLIIVGLVILTSYIVARKRNAAAQNEPRP